MVSMETDRLILRNFDSADAEPLRQMILQYEASGYAAYDQQWPTALEQIQGAVQWFASGDHFLAVCLKESGDFMGFVSLNPEEADKEYNIGYIFRTEYHGKGYATEACRAVLRRAFGSLQAQRVVSGTAALNHASCRLLERLGFSKTGESLGSFRSTPEGVPIEFLGYSYELTRADWMKANS